MTLLYTTLKSCLAAEQPAAVATIVDGAGQVGAKLLVRPDEALLGTLGDHALNETVERDALAMLLRAESGIRTYTVADGEVQVSSKPTRRHRRCSSSARCILPFRW